MLDIQKSIKKIIERFIANIRTNTSAIGVGDTSLTITSAKRFQTGDTIVIYDPSNPSDGGYVRNISSVDSNRIITIDNALGETYAANQANIQKMLGFDAGSQSFMKGIFLGDPAVISRFPAITIDGKSRSAEWLTLDSAKERYEIDITVYVQASDYEQQYELMHHYIKCIESSLFRSFYPLVEPYVTSTLAQDAESGDTVIQLTEEEMMICSGGWFFLESFDHLEPHRVRNYLGHGIYELMIPIIYDYDRTETTVVEPRRHIFNSFPASTRYGTVMKGTMLKAGQISYFCEEERLLRYPFVDAITF